MKKINKSILIIIIGVCLLFAGVGIYSYITYKQGLAEGEKIPKQTQKKHEQIPFQPEEVKFGEIKVLLIGNDAREKGGGRSDSLMIASYNQKTKQAKIASIMRDSYVQVPGHGMQKINAAYAFGGPELLRKTIEKNFDVDVNYYAMIDFDGFSKMVDLIAPDGVEVDIKKKMSSGINVTLNPGKQVLHGKELLGYVRFRHDVQSDFGRVQRQQEVLSKLKHEAIQLHSLVKLPKIIGIAEAYVDTNVDTATIFTVAKGLLTTKKELKTMRLPVNGGYDNERTQQGAVLRLDLEKNKQALQTFFAEQKQAPD